MRCNPWRWMWGLLPLGLLCATALYFESGQIEADLQTRAEAALAGAGLKWAKASSDGRDVAITGKALDDADPVRAESIVRDVWGVRVASNQVELVEKAESFLWYVSRDGNRARLRGMVPNEDTRAAIIGCYIPCHAYAIFLTRLLVANRDTAMSNVYEC